MISMRPADLVAAFQDLSLPKTEWTHEAHLIVCWDALQHMEVEEAITFLRGAIQTYNQTTGTPNTDTSGYHETITRYYVTAVAQIKEQPLECVYSSLGCRRDAPLKYWSRDTLFSTAARRGWVEPDLIDLPWPRTPNDAEL
jgi:hypothetical protein